MPSMNELNPFSFWRKVSDITKPKEESIFFKHPTVLVHVVKYEGTLIFLDSPGILMFCYFDIFGFFWDFDVLLL